MLLKDDNFTDLCGLRIKEAADGKSADLIEESNRKLFLHELKRRQIAQFALFMMAVSDLGPERGQGLIIFYCCLGKF